MGSLLMTALVLAVLWSGGLALLMGQLARGPRAERVRVDWRGRWQHALERHQAVAEAYARFECDAKAVLATPGLADVRQPPTARFVDAFAEAVALATERYPARAFARRFIEAVEREEQAWAAAVGAAERSRDARFSPAERDLLEQTRRLLDDRRVLRVRAGAAHRAPAGASQAPRPGAPHRLAAPLPRRPGVGAAGPRRAGCLRPLRRGKPTCRAWVTSPAHGESARRRSLAVSVPYGSGVLARVCSDPPGVACS